MFVQIGFNYELGMNETPADAKRNAIRRSSGPIHIVITGYHNEDQIGSAPSFEWGFRSDSCVDLLNTGRRFIDELRQSKFISQTVYTGLSRTFDEFCRMLCPEIQGLIAGELGIRSPMPYLAMGYVTEYCAWFEF